MGKKAAKGLARADSLRLVTSAGTTRRRELAHADDHSADPFVDELLTKVHSSCGTESEAISLLISSVLDNLEGHPTHQAEMKEFLQTLIDTDPDLRRDIVSGLQIRK